MEWWLILALLLGSLIFLMATGLPVAFCFMLINLVGVTVLWGGVGGLHQLILSMWESISRFSLLPIPLFVLLGEVMFQSGIGLRAIDVLDKWLGRLPGRLGLLAIGAATLFSTMSGATTATTAMLGEVLVPEMERRGYKKPISIGSVMGSGGLAMLIPPSALAVLLASLAEISIGSLLIAGIVPGLVIACFYAGYVIIRCWLQPSIAPSYKVIPTALSEKVVLTIRYVLPLGSIVFLVTGIIFLGVATPSEAAATGTLGTILLAATYRKLNWEMLKKSLFGTLGITVMLLMIFTGAKAFSQIMAFTGATRTMIELVVNLPLTPILIIVAMQVVLLFMGTFLSALPMMMITLPIFMPIIYVLGFDPIWFGVLFLVNIEIGQTTPPFGLLLFIMKGVAPPDTTMGDIYRAGLPFIGCDLFAMALIIAFPTLALWLPNLMR